MFFLLIRFSSLMFGFRANLHGDCTHKLPSCCSPALLAFGLMLTVSNSNMLDGMSNSCSVQKASRWRHFQQQITTAFLFYSQFVFHIFF